MRSYARFIAIVLPSIAAGVVLLAAHGVTFYSLSSWLNLSAALIFGVIALAVVTHLGLLFPLLTWVRRKRSADAKE